MFGNVLLFFNSHPLTWLFFFFRKIVLNCVCVLYISPDPRGVISTTHPSKTAPCLQLAWENLRLKPITPLTSTETCEFHWNSFVQFFSFFFFLQPQSDLWPWFWFLRYFEGGVSSVYLWDLDHGFAGVILIKKAGDGSKKIKGCWDSIHVVEVQVRIGPGGVRSYLYLA